MPKIEKIENVNDVRKFAKEKVQSSPYGYHKSLAPYKAMIENDTKGPVHWTFKQHVYHFINPNIKPPKCVVCGEEDASFRNPIEGYGECCSTRCAGIMGTKHLHKIDQAAKVAKMRKTNMERYGTKSQLARPEIQQQMKENAMEKYGVEHHMHLEETKEKIKKTNMEKYGVEHWFQTKEAREMSSKNMKEKLESGVYMKSLDYIDATYGTRNFFETDEYISRYIDNRNISEDTFNQLIEILSHEDETKKKIPLKTISNKLGVPVNFIKHINKIKGLEYTPEHRISAFELELGEYVSDLVGEENVLLNDRTLLGGQRELDIYIPSKNIAIECNGIYWHSDKFKDKKYHYNKYKDCKSNGIQLIQITDVDYYKDKEKWLSLVKAKLGFSENNIYARHCVVKQINNYAVVSDFLKRTHAQDSKAAQYYYGLYKEDVLYAVMSFSKGKHYTYEISRFACEQNTNVVGGFSKLLTAFIKENCETGDTIMSYAHGFWSHGNVYAKNGFTFIAHTEPNYKWTSNKGKTLSRNQTQLHKLKEHFPDANITSEDDFMRSKGYHKYYDAGNSKWVLTVGIESC